ncbi:hypothetical protein D3C85_1469130 [compost metagenome]
MTTLQGQGALQDGDDGEPLAEPQRGERRGGKAADDRDVDDFPGRLYPTHVKVAEPDTVVALLLQAPGQRYHCRGIFTEVQTVFDTGAALVEVEHLDAYVRRHYRGDGGHQGRVVGTAVDRRKHGDTQAHERSSCNCPTLR